VKKIARAFAPAAISSFFEICDRNSNGKPILDLEKVGARGGGFGLQKGITSQVTILEAETNQIQVFINGNLSPEAKTTEITLETLLGKAENTYNVTVNHNVEVPIGAGFGTSAGGSLTAGLALKEALDLPLTSNQVGKVAHVAEIKCQTGIGTISSLVQGGGCVLVVEPGAPGNCIVDRIPLEPNYVLVAGVFKSIPKTTVFASTQKRREVDRCGRKTLDNILDDPCLENFLTCCWEFALDAGFATARVRELVRIANKAGAIGAAQNMVGEAVHAVTLEKNATEVSKAFRQVLPSECIFISKLDNQGARLVS
jgi:pantoate kinase